jgi:hypothetical protein
MSAKDTLRRFMAVYGEPRTPDPDEFLTEFAACLEGCDASALRKATDRLIRKSSFWPKPAEVLEAVSSILAERDRQMETTRRPPNVHEQFKLATGLVQGPLGKIAARDGWVRGLWDFCRVHERLPGEREQREIIASAREHVETVAGLAKKRDLLSKELFKLSMTMAERETQLCEIVAGTRAELTPITAVKWGEA